MPTTIVALFDHYNYADYAVEELLEGGFLHKDIALLSGHYWNEQDPDYGPGAFAHRPVQPLNHGSVLVRVHTRRENLDQALDILDKSGAREMRELVEDWQPVGWAVAVETISIYH